MQPQRCADSCLPCLLRPPSLAVVFYVMVSWYHPPILLTGMVVFLPAPACTQLREYFQRYNAKKVRPGGSRGAEWRDTDSEGWRGRWVAGWHQLPRRPGLRRNACRASHVPHEYHADPYAVSATPSTPPQQFGKPFTDLRQARHQVRACVCACVRLAPSPENPIGGSAHEQGCSGLKSAHELRAGEQIPNEGLNRSPDLTAGAARGLLIPGCTAKRPRLPSYACCCASTAPPAAAHDPALARAPPPACLTVLLRRGRQRRPAAPQPHRRLARPHPVRPRHGIHRQRRRHGAVHTDHAVAAAEQRPGGWWRRRAWRRRQQCVWRPRRRRRRRRW